MSEIKLNKHHEMFLTKLRNRKTIEIPNVQYFREQAELTELSFIDIIRNYGGKVSVVQHSEEQITSMTINFNSPIVKVEIDFSKIKRSRIEEMVSNVYGDNHYYKKEDMAKDNHIVIINKDEEVTSVYLGELIKQFLLND